MVIGIIGALVIILSLLILIIVYPDYGCIPKNDHPTITFKQFKAYYEMSSNHWALEEHRIYYEGHFINFKTFSDWIKYRIFFEKIEKGKVKHSQIENQLEFIQAIQRDINMQYDDINKFIKENTK